MSITNTRQNSDLRYLPEFSAWLSGQHVTPKTIKNYVSDVRRFLVWLEARYPGLNLTNVQADAADVYLQELGLTGTSPNTIQRKRASLRRFGDFWSTTYSATTPVQIRPSNTLNAADTRNNPVAAWDTLLRRFSLALEADNCKESTVKNYVVDVGLFAESCDSASPYEIFTKTRIDSYLRQLRFEGSAGTTISRKSASLHRFAAWALEEELIEVNPFVSRIETIKETVKNTVASRFAPLAFFEKRTSGGSVPVTRDLEMVRPSDNSPREGRTLLKSLYQAYSATRVSSYIHLAILVIFSVAIGLLAYQQFGPQAADPFAYPSDLTSPGRILSFQGRATVTDGTPISAPINMEFRLYNDATAGVLLWETSPACSIDPDIDGVFSTLLGDTCGPTIQQDVFSENSEVWLEVQIGSETLSPRQRIASVAYALNAETLQGFPPSLSGGINTIPVINALGEVIIGANNPSLIASSGAFLIQAESMTFQTEAGTAGDINFAPDAGGTVNVLSGTTSQDSLYVSNANLTSGNLIHGYVGNNSGTGNLLYLGGGSTETTRLAVSKMGDLFVGRAATISGSLKVDTNTLFVDDVNNRVGIGTTGPSTSLHVAGSTGLRVESQSGYFLDTKTTLSTLTDFSNPYMSLNYNSAQRLNFGFQDGGANNNWGRGALFQSLVSGRGMTFALPNTSDFRITGSTTGNSASTDPVVFLVNSSGSVGIGDTSPVSLFTVGSGDLFQVNSSGNIVALGGAAQSIANVSNDLVLTSVDDLMFNDVRTGSIPLTVADTALNAALGQGIVDAINDAYAAAIGGGGGVWTDGGTFSYLTTLTDDAIIGGNSVATADIFLGDDGSAVFNEQGNDADFRIEGDTDANLFFTDAGNSRVGIGTAAPGSKLDIQGGIAKENGYSLADAATNNLLVNGDFEMNGSYGWTGVSAVGTGGYSGNYAASITGPATLESEDYIPVDPTRDILQLEGYFKKSVVGTTPGIFYFGYKAYDVNKAPISTAPCGSWCYFAASGAVISADGNWHKYSATTTGEGTVYPNFPVGTRYIRVLGLVNYSGSGDTVTQIDHLTLRRMPTGPLFVGNNFSSTNLVDQYQVSKLYTTSSNNFIIEPAGTGNVGIGNTTPGAKLQIDAAASAKGLIIKANATTPGNIFEAQNSAGTGLVAITGAGSLGIGITAPAQELHVKAASGNGDMRLESSDGPYLDYFAGSTSTGYSGIWAYGANNHLAFGTNGTEKLRVTTGGNIGVGDTTPASMFTVGSGDLFQVNSSGNIVALGGAAQSIANVSNDLVLTSVDDLMFNDVRTGSIPLTVADTALDAALGQGIIDAINDAYAAAIGGGGGLWTDGGTFSYLTAQTDDIVIGGNSVATADIFLGDDGSTVFNEQGNDADFRIESDTEANALFVDGATGNVGIGDTSPVAKLAVGDDTTYNGTLFVGNVGVITGRLANFGNAFEITTGVGPSWTGQGFRVDGSNRTFQLIGSAANTTDNYVFALIPGSGSLFSAPTSGSKGLVDIGSTANFAPTSGTATYSVLDVRSTVNQTGGANGITRGIYINPTLTAAADWRAIEIANASGFGVYQSGASTQNYFAGSVGIGTTTPSEKLEVLGNLSLGASGNKLIFDRAGATATTQDYIYAAAGSGNLVSVARQKMAFQIDSDNTSIDNTFTFRTNGVADSDGTELMRITEAGNVGIGTTSPSQKLQVNTGTILAKGPQVPGSGFGSDYSTVGGSNSNQVFTTTGTTSIMGYNYYGSGGGFNPVLKTPLGAAYGTVGITGFAASAHTGGTSAIGVYGSATHLGDTSYGGLFTADADIAALEAMTLYGSYNFGSSSLSTISGNSVYGSYNRAVGISGDTTYGGYFIASGGTTNYSIYSAAGTNYFSGNVGVGDTSPASLFTVGSGDLFQINSFGIIANIDGVAHTIDDVSGNLTLTSNSAAVSVADGLNVSGTITANGGLITRAAGALSLTTTTSGNIAVDSAGELYFNDVRTGNIPLTLADTALNAALGQGIVDAINDAYAAAIGGGGGVWTDGGTFSYLTTLTDDVVIGGNSVATADIFFGDDGSAVFNEQGNDADFRIEGDTDANLLFTDAGNGRVGIGTAAPGYKLDVSGHVNISQTSKYLLSGNQIAIPTEESLVGHWGFDDGSGTLTIDRSSSGNNGTLANSPAWTNNGVSGSHLNFNSTSSRVTLGTPVGQTGYTTVSLWYKRSEASASASWRTLLAVASGNIHHLIINDTTRAIGVFDGSFRAFTYVPPDDGQFHHYAIVYNSASTATLYVDGVYQQQIAIILNLSTNPIGQIGNWSGGGYNAGPLDEVSIYNRALSDAEIRALYLNPKNVNNTYLASNRLRGPIHVDANGNVGVGTTAPNTSLEVVSATGIRATSTSFLGDRYIEMKHDNTLATIKTSVGNTKFTNGTDTLVAVLDNGNRRLGVNQAAPIATLDIAGGATIGTNYSGVNAPAANGLLVEGNVGIGLTSPAATLDVNQSVKVTGTRPIFLNTESANGGYGVKIQGVSGGWAHGYTFNGSAGTALGGFGAYGGADALTRYFIGVFNTDEKMSILSTGNVGVGDNSPASLFTVGFGDLFQVNSSGIIANIDGVAHTIDDVSGNLTLTSNSSAVSVADGLNVSGTITANGGLITRAAGALSLTTTTSGNLTLDSAGELYLNDTRTGNIPLSVADTALNAALGQGIVDAINDVYATTLASTGFWLRPDALVYTNNAQNDSLAIGGTASSSADIVLNANGSAVFNEQGNDADFRIESDTDANALFVDGTNGNVGIGVAVPTNKLQVAGNVLSTDGTANGKVLLGAVSTYPGIWFGSNTTTPSVTNYSFLYDAALGTILNSPVGSVSQRIANTTYSVLNANGLSINNGSTGTTAGVGLVVGSGDVGIGLTNPGAKLQVDAAASGKGLIVKANATTPGSIFEAQNSTGTVLANITSDGRGGFGAAVPANVGLYTNGVLRFDGQLYVGNATEIQVRDTTGTAYTRGIAGLNYIRAGGTGNSYISGTGNFGVGTASPGTKLAVLGGSENLFTSNITKAAGVDAQINGVGALDVAFTGDGAAAVSGAYSYYGARISNTFVSSDNTGAAANIGLQVDVSGGDTNYAALFNGGSVGIGTMTPTSQLHVVGTTLNQVSGVGANTALRVNATQPNADGLAGFWDFYTNTALVADFFGRTGFKFQGGSTDPFKQYQVYVSDGATPKLVVNGSGNVGIGDTSPASMFTVGTGDLFQVSSSGIISNIDGVAHTIDDVAGDLTLTSNSAAVSVADGLNVSGTITANGGLVTRATGALSLTTTTSGNITVDSAGELYLNDVRTGNIPLSVADTALDAGLGQGIVDAINDAYAAAIGGGGGLWTDGGTFSYLTTQTDDVVIGGNSVATADIFLGDDGSAVFNEQGNDADFRIEGDTDANLFVADAGNGRIGIGTAAPTSLLHVNNPVTTGSALISHLVSAEGRISTEGGSGISVNPTFEVGVARTNLYGLKVTPNINNYVGGVESTNFYSIYSDATAGAGTVTNAYGLYVNAPTAGANNYGAYIDGNVGIGTTTPSSLLNVKGTNAQITVEDGAVGAPGITFKTNNAARGSIVVDSANNNNILLQTASIGIGNKLGIGYSGNTLANMTAVLAVNGNVGIGTTSPTNILSLGNSAAQKIWIENTATDVVGRALTLAAGGTVAGTAVSDVTGGNLILQSGLGTGTGASTISFQTGTTLTTGTTLQTMSTKMTILGNGNVGIGTTSPVAKLHIEGMYNAIATNTGNARFLLNVDTSNIPSLEFHRGTTGFNQGSYAGFIDFAYTDNADFDTRMALTSATAFTFGGTANYNFARGAVVGGTSLLYIQNSTGNVGIGDTTPASMFTVGTGDLFQVNSSGIISNIDGVAHTIDDVSGNLTLTSNSTTLSLADNTNITGYANTSTGYYYGGTGSPSSVELTRTLPTVVNDYVEIGNVSLTNGAHNLRVSITVSSNAFSVAKTYVIPVKYGQTSGAWQNVAPIHDTGAYASNDYALDINVNAHVATLRIRRSLGTTAGTALVRIESTGSTADVFTATSTTGTTTAPTALFSSTPLAQVENNVGVGDISPASLFTVGSGDLFQVNSSGNIVALGGAAQSIANVSNDLVLTSVDDLMFNDVRTGNIPLSVADTALDAALGQGIVDAINDAYAAATGAGGGIWTDGGTFSYLTTLTDDVVIGGNSVATADIFLGDDGSAVFNEQGNDADFRIESDTVTNAFFVDGTNGNVGMGTVTPGTTLDVIGDIRSSNGLIVTAGTVALPSNQIDSAEVNFNYAASSSKGGPALTLEREDNRTISPSELANGQMKFGFTSYTNNNAAPWADFLHLRSYIDSSGGLDNLLMFNKSGGLGMRIYQQTFGSATAYSTYKDIALVDNGSIVNYLPKFSTVGTAVSMTNSTIFDNGNIGIGTNSPTNILSFGNAAARKIWIENTATDVVGRALTLAAGGTVAGTAVSDVTGGNLILQSGLGTGAGASTISFQTGTTLGTGTTLQTMSTKMTILGSGNVGIGTTSPTVPLQVAGRGIVTGGFTVGGTSAPANNRLRLDQTDGAAAASVIEFYNGTHSMFWFLEGSATGGRGQIRTDSARAIVLQDVASSTGGVGVGEVNPGSKLSVRGGVSIGSSTYSSAAAPANGLIVEGSVGIGDASPASLFTVGSGDLFQVNSSGIIANIDGVAHTIDDVSGNLTLTSNSAAVSVADGLNVSGTITANGGLLTRAAGALSLTTTTSGNITVDSAGELYLSDTRTGNIPLSVADTALDVALGQGIIDAINDAYAAAVGGGGGVWTDGGTFSYLTTQTDDVVIGGNSVATADIFLGDDGSAVFNEQGNDVDFRIEGDTEVNALFVDGTNGNVGIGTASPLKKLSLSSSDVAAGFGTSTAGIDIANAASGVGRLAELSFMYGPQTSAATDRYAAISGITTGQGAGTIGDILLSTKATVGAVALTERMRITAAGSVGIGATSPNELFEIKDAAGTNAEALRISTTGSWGTGVGTGISFYDSVNRVGHIQVTYNGTQTRMDFGGLYNSGYGSAATQFMSIVGNGNVGIGTTGPSAKFQVNASAVASLPTVNSLLNTVYTTANVTGGQESLVLSNSETTPSTALIGSSLSFKAATFGGSSGYSTGRIFSYFDDAAGSNPGYAGAVLALQYPTADNTFTTGMVLKNGSVGIGTTSPQRLLEVTASSATEVTNLRLTNTSWTANELNTMEFYSGTPTGTNLVTSAIKSKLYSGGTSGELQFWTNNSSTLTQQMTILNNGNVGIGSIAPGAKLQIDAAASGKGIIVKNNATTPGNHFEGQDSSGVSDSYIDSSGNFYTKAGGANGTGAQLLASTSYVQSRGMNLLTNGSGLLGNNYNFSGFTFDQTDTHGGKGSFQNSTLNANVSNDEQLPVDGTKMYRLSVWAKSTTHAVGAHAYIGVSPYDVDGNVVIPFTYMKWGGSTDTTLAAQLNPGDTTVTLTDATGWNNGATAYARNLVWYGYTNSFGYTYPDYTYTRNGSYNYSDFSSNGAWAASGISGNVITLRAAWTGPTVPAGAAVRNTSSGGTFKYIAAANVDIPNAWTNYTGKIGGWDTTGSGATNLFPYGTSSVKLLFLLNRDVAGNVTNLSDLWFSELSADNLELATASQQGVVSTTTQTFGGNKTFSNDVYISGNVGIGDTSPASLFTVGSGDLFQINTSGIIARIDGVAHTIDDVAGNLTLTSNSTAVSIADALTISGTITANGGLITRAAGALSLTTTTSGNLTLDSAGELYFNDVRTGNIPLSVADTALNVALGQGIVDAINDVYAIAMSGGVWTDGGTFSYVTTLTDDIVIGGNSVATADIFLGDDGSVVFNEQGNDADFRIESDTEVNALFVDGANGRVGIGTGVPDAKFNILQASNSQGDGFRQTYGTSYWEWIVDSPTSGGLWLGANGTNRVQITNAGSFGIGDASPASLFTVGSGDLFQVNSSGNIISVGGTTHKIEAGTVLDNLSVSQNVLRLTPNGNYTEIDSDLILKGGDIYGPYTTNLGANPNMSLLSNSDVAIHGKLGLGTTSPTNILSLGNSAAQKIWIENTATDVVGRALTLAAGGTVAGTSVSDVTGGNLILQSGLGTGSGASTISFQTGTTLGTGTTLQTMSTKMTILGNGNVGIGTISPGAKLQIDAAASGKGLIVKANATTPGSIFEAQDSASTVIANIASDGRAGFGAAVPSGIGLYTNGTLRFDGQLFVGHASEIQIRDTAGNANTRGISGLNYIRAGGTGNSYISGSGYFGIGDSTPASLFSVGSGDLFQVNSSGIISNIDGVAHTIDDISGNLTLTSNSTTVSVADDLTVSGNIECTNCIDTGDLKTSTGTANGGGGAANITMNDYAFFPNIERNNCSPQTEVGLQSYGADATDDTVGRFRLASGCTNNDIVVRWRYVTASRDQEIFAWYDTTNQILRQVWSSEIAAGTNGDLPSVLDEVPADWIPVQATIFDDSLTTLGEMPNANDIMKNHTFTLYEKASELSASNELVRTPTEKHDQCIADWSARQPGMSQKDLESKCFQLITHPDIYYGKLERSATATATWAQIDAESGAVAAANSNTTGADLAELYNGSDDIEAGDIIAIDRTNETFLVKAQAGTDATALAGVMSTSAHTVMGQSSEGNVELALAGRVPVKISEFSKPILPGDSITVSAEPGKGKKATQAGWVVGRALEAWNPGDEKNTILVLIGTSSYSPLYAMNDLDVMNIITNASGSTEVYDQNGDLLSNISAFSNSLIGSLTAGSISARNIAVENLTINGQSLTAFVEQMVATAVSNLQTTGSNLVASVIRPDENGSVTIDLGPFSATSSASLQISNGENTVASIDNAGNAQFSGNVTAETITAQNLIANDMNSRYLTAEDLAVTNASVSGELNAETIAANSARVNTLEAQNATISGVLYADRIESNFETRQISDFEQRVADIIARERAANVDSTLETLITQNFEEETQLTGLIADQTNLTASGSGLLAQGADVELGAVSALNLNLDTVLSIGQTFMLNSTSLAFNVDENCASSGNNSSSDDSCRTFFFQPSGAGRLSFLADAMVLSRDGGLVINTDVLIAGRLTARGGVSTNLISALPGENIEINLSGAPTEAELLAEAGIGSAVPGTNLASENAASDLVIRGNNGKEVAAFTASGSARLQKLVIAAETATADENEVDTSIQTNATTGTATIAAGSTEFLIRNSNVTDNSLIYVTPTSDTKNKVIFVKAKLSDYQGTPDVNEAGFIVSVSQPILDEIGFNWWIVEGSAPANELAQAN